MALTTIVSYEGDGKTSDFTIPFDYLAKKFVRLILSGKELKGGTSADPSVDYYFVTGTLVRLRVAPPAGSLLTVKRVTSATERIVSFKNGSVLQASSLDISSLQAMHIAEEARDVSSLTLGKNKFEEWDAKGHKIINVGEPTLDADAATKGYADRRLEANLGLITNLTKQATTARDESVAIYDDLKSGLSDLHEIKEPVVIVSNSIDKVVTTANNIDSVRIVGADLDSNSVAIPFDDYGDLSNPTGSPVVSGGNIKTVSDNIQNIDTNAKNIDKIIQVADSIDNLPNIAEIFKQDLKASKEAAEQSRLSAVSSQESKQASQQFATEAQGHSSTALAQATNAANSAKVAQTSEGVATTKATEATQQATLAESNATLAKNWASKTGADPVVTDGDYSAKMWATWDGIVKDGKGSAFYYAKQAGQSKDTAKAQADRAFREAERAKQSADSIVQVQADWNQTVSTEKDFIKNKPTLLSADKPEVINRWWRFKDGLETSNVIQCLKEPFADNHLTTMKWVKGYVDPKVSNLENKKANTDWVTRKLEEKLDTSVFNSFIDYGDLGTK